MKNNEKILIGIEEWVLMTIISLGEDKAYSVEIASTMETAMGKRISLGALHSALSRLEQKGYIRSWTGQPTQQRGGRAKRFYSVESEGKQALRNTKSARLKLTPQLSF